MRNFLWEANKEEKKIYWSKWCKLCNIKDIGGFGFMDMSTFNDVLHAKQGWRILTIQNYIIYRCLKAKYFPNTSFWKVNSKNSDFYLLKNINIWKTLGFLTKDGLNS